VSARYRLLLVEDNPGDARLIREMLAGENGVLLDLQCAASLSGGLRLLGEASFDVVLLDLGLPDSQGLDTFARLHAKFPRVPSIVLSGNDNVELAVRAVQAGAQDYLVKGDISGDTLARAIRAAIERERARDLLRLTAQIFDRLNSSSSTAPLIRELLLLIKNDIGVEAAGIRLREGDDFPYFETSGFSDDFVASERSLCPHEAAGDAAAGDSRGDVWLECMCGNVLQGRSDPAPPFFTPGGSFWTNSTTQLLAGTSEENPLARMKNRCHGEGYESVALIPLRSGEKIIGLLQLNDRRPGRFTTRLITLLEVLGASIGLAVARLRSEAALKESEERYHSLFDQSPIGIYRTTPDGRILLANPALLRMLGYSSVDELRARNLEERGFEPDYPRQTFKDAIEREGKVRALEAAWTTKNGQSLHVREYAHAIRDTTGEALYYEGAIEDITAEREAQQALRASEERYRTLAEAAQEGIFVVGGDLRFQFVNSAVEQQLGRRADEIVGKRLDEVLVPRSAEQASAANLRVLSSGLPLRFEETLTFPRGDRYLETALTPLRNAGGEVVSVLGIARDITERVVADELLRASELRYRLLFERSVAGLYHSTMEGDFLNCNEAFAKMLGYASPGEAMQRKTYDFYASPPAREALLAELRQNGSVQSRETQLKTADGSLIWVLLSAALVPDENGDWRVIEGTVVDITKRKQADTALQESEARYRGLFEQALIGIYHTTPDGRILLANDALLRMLGYSSVDELRSRDLEGQEFEPGYSRQHFRDIIEREGDVRGLEAVWKTRTGRSLHVRESAHPIRDADGKTLFYEGAVEDITREVELREQLTQSQKLEAIGRFAGGIAHDFNNLLQAMLGTAQVVRGQQHDPERAAEAAGELEELVQRGASLTRQLLLFSRRETAKPERLDLNEVIRDAIQILKRLLRANINLGFELSARPLFVHADRGQLSQVLMNLAVNASDAMPDGGVFTIRTGADGERMVYLSVEDTGHGIPDEIRTQIFDPFFTTKDVGKGTGLGLSVVHGIVAQHGGRIEVESAVGKGTTFKVTLPGVALGESAAVGAPGTATSDLPMGKGERVLIVEDEEAARATLRDILVSLGYEVVATGSGEEAGLLPADPPFDLLLTDLMLPGISGQALVRGLRDRWPAMKIVLMSGYTDDEAVRHGVSLGEVAFLQKPFGISSLARELRVTLDETGDKRRGGL
jgi:PAS domain S-box-containing protein